MRLTTWNVNGIRNPFSYPPWNTARSFPAMFDILESDIVVMQELKIQRKDLKDDMVLIDGWDCYFSLPKHKKGYSGVGIYTRNAVCAPIKAEEGLLGVLPSPSGTAYRDLPEADHIGGYPSALQIADLGVDPAALDAEGRCVVVEFPAFILFGVYSPANSNGLRDDFRYGFICALDCRIRNLIRQGKNVVLVGDLNVTRHESDSGPTLEDIRKNLATREEYLSSPNRRIFNQLLMGGDVIGDRDEGRETGVLWDTTRAFHPDRRAMYTHWETKINARPGNYGSRIDFVLTSEAMKEWVTDANIQEGLLGSDHCPVYVDFGDEVLFSGHRVNLLDIMNPSGCFINGSRKVEWKISSTPAFSAKRMPEFDKRRTIMSMFSASATKKPSNPSESRSDSPVKPLQTTSTQSVLEGALSSEPQGRNEDASPPVGTDGTRANLSQNASKRKAPDVAKDTTTKRQKPDVKPRGQQSLTGFFSSKTPTKPRLPLQLDEEQTSKATQTYPIGVQSEADSAQGDMPTVVPESPSHNQTAVSDTPSPSPAQFALQLASAEQTQRSWGALFAKPVAPLCESHVEPCKTMQTKKKGSNQGRSFWM